MKSLITRIASIGIFSLVLAGLSATTQAQTINPSVEVDKAVIMGEQTSTIVLVEVTYTCIAGAATTVSVSISQTSGDSSNGVGGSGSGSEPVACNGKPRRISVSIPNAFGPTFNLGRATVVAHLNMGVMSIATETETLRIGFPGGGGEEH